MRDLPNYNDPRNRRLLNDSDHEVDASGKFIVVEIFDGDESKAVRFPAKYEVCPVCDGRGKHVNPAIDDNGISGEDFADDPDFREDYFSGMYDVTCNECRGARVVSVINEAACTSEELKDALKLYHAQERENAEFRAIQRAELMMGA